MSDLSAACSEAVLFFDDRKICKEMLYMEFEAILDGVVGIEEFANRPVKAAFVVINGQLAVTACVLFAIQFDRDGMVSKNWNIPLRHLADTAGPGPDMGAGPIRFSCRSQCSVSWHHSSLWDPEMNPQNNTFVKIRDALKRNRLCLSVSAEAANGSATPVTSQFTDPLPQTMAGAPVQQVAPASPPPIPNQPTQPMATAPEAASPALLGVDSMVAGQSAQATDYELYDKLKILESEQREKIAKLIRAQRLHIQTLTNKHQEETGRLKLEARQTNQKSEIEIAQLRSQIESLHSQNMALREQCEAQRSQLESMKSTLDVKIKEAQQHERQEVETITNKYEAIVEERVKEETAKVKEELQLREMELLYRHEVAKQLREELTILRKDKIRLVNSGADKFLEKLEQLGISFIAFHPGAGHISILLSDMAQYMENPVAYAANKCLVSEDEYREWLSHYENPLCQACFGKDQHCGVKITRIDVPSEFKPGMSDRCMKHQPKTEDSDKVVNLVK